MSRRRFKNTLYLAVILCAAYTVQQVTWRHITAPEPVDLSNARTFPYYFLAVALDKNGAYTLVTFAEWSLGYQRNEIQRPEKCLEGPELADWPLGYVIASSDCTSELSFNIKRESLTDAVQHVNSDIKRLLAPERFSEELIKRGIELRILDESAAGRTMSLLVHGNTLKEYVYRVEGESVTPLGFGARYWWKGLFSLFAGIAVAALFHTFAKRIGKLL